MDFSQTYLYKLRKLTTTLDRVFDQTLRAHTHLSLSQFTFLLALNTFGQTSQQKIASFLDISTPAVSRQADIASENGWIKRTTSLTDRHGYSLQLTPQGKRVMQHGLNTLETHVFKIFTNEQQQTDLMGHIDMLLNNIKTVAREQTTLQPQKKTMMERNFYDI